MSVQADALTGMARLTVTVLGGEASLDRSMQMTFWFEQPVNALG